MPGCASLVGKTLSKLVGREGLGQRRGHGTALGFALWWGWLAAPALRHRGRGTGHPSAPPALRFSIVLRTSEKENERVAEKCSSADFLVSRKLTFLFC